MSGLAEKLRAESKWLQAEATRYGRNGDEAKMKEYLFKAARWLSLADYADGRTLVTPSSITIFDPPKRVKASLPDEGEGEGASLEEATRSLQADLDRVDGRVLPE